MSPGPGRISSALSIKESPSRFRTTATKQNRRPHVSSRIIRGTSPFPERLLGERLRVWGRTRLGQPLNVAAEIYPGASRLISSNIEHILAIATFDVLRP